MRTNDGRLLRIQLVGSQDTISFDSQITAKGQLKLSCCATQAEGLNHLRRWEVLPADSALRFRQHVVEDLEQRPRSETPLNPVRANDESI